MCNGTHIGFESVLEFKKHLQQIGTVVIGVINKNWKIGGDRESRTSVYIALLCQEK